MLSRLGRCPRLHRHGADDAGGAGADSREAGYPSADAALGFVAQQGAPPRPLVEPRPGMPLFFDAHSGVAGDMIVGAFIDLGVPLHVFDSALRALALDGVSYGVASGHVGAIGATRFWVNYEAQPSRSYADIRTLLDRAPLGREQTTLAQRIFLRLAEAEAEVHRVELDRVHFHEVGGADSIVDIVFSAVGASYMRSRIVVSPLPLGRGSVLCQHGPMPLPAPATLLALRGVPTFDSGLNVELVTPTGAAIVATLASDWTRWPAMSVERVGWGAGTRTLRDRPNALRLVLGNTDAEAAESITASHIQLECNVDDMTGEAVAYLIERLLEAGALDVWAVPSTAKKGRPAWVLAALCTANARERLCDVLLSESTSIGVRWTPVMRKELPRRAVVVETPYGRVSAKVSGEPGAPDYHAKPDFDSCRALAREQGVTLREVTAAAVAALRVRA